MWGCIFFRRLWKGCCLYARFERGSDRWTSPDGCNMVVVGGGPAGVELAMGVKSVNPHKNVTLVHSQKTLLNNFGTKFHDVALEALEGLGVRVILGEQIQTHGEDDGSVVLVTGAAIPCDLLVCSPYWHSGCGLSAARFDAPAKRLRQISSPSFTPILSLPQVAL